MDKALALGLQNDLIAPTWLNFCLNGIYFKSIQIFSLIFNELYTDITLIDRTQGKPLMLFWSKGEVE